VARPRNTATVAYADTNLFLALLAGPDHSLHARALDLFARVDAGSLRLIVTPVVVAELVWASRAALGITRSEMAGILTDLLQAGGLDVLEPGVVFRALRLQQARPRLDFADAHLAARALEVGPPVVASFDDDLDGVPGVERLTA
jgi:predicted nucleic acid-binding protein